MTTSQHEHQHKHWSNVAEKSTLLGMRILLRAYEWGGDWVFRLLLFPVILFFLVFHPLARHSSRDYLSRMHARNPQFPAPRIWHVYRHLWNFGTILLDKLAVWRGRIVRADVNIHNSEVIDELLDQGRGAILLISHLGNFEICQALSEDRSRLRLTVLQHTAHAAKFNHFLDSQSRETRVEFMQVRDVDVADAMRLKARLEAGQFIAIAADRVPLGNSNRVASVDFLGQPASFPTGPFVLAMVLQAPVLSLQCVKLDGRYHIYFEVLATGEPVPRANRPSHLQALMGSYVRNLEMHCMAAPWQWFNYYPFWQDGSPGKQTG